MKVRNSMVGHLRLLSVIAFSIFCVANGRAQHSIDIPNLPFEVEMRRLDDVATELKLDQKKFVHLVAFSAIDKSKRTAIKRLSMSRSYLLKKHKISPDRVKTIYAGCKESLIMQIHIGTGEVEQRDGPEWITPADNIKRTCKK